MKISNSTGKNKDFYDLGKKKFDQIRVLPEHQAIPQIPQKHSSKRMTVFELIEANGLTLHGDIEHFAALVAAAERADERNAIYDQWHSCVMSDLENGVKFLNEKAATEWQKNYPAQSKTFPDWIEARGNT